MWVISFAFYLVQFILIERWLALNNISPTPKTRRDIDKHASPTGDGRPIIGRLSRRPGGLFGIIQYMQMEDHYFQVFTNEGDGSTLHRMSDLAETDRLQVPKSWWMFTDMFEAIAQVCDLYLP